MIGRSSAKKRNRSVDDGARTDTSEDIAGVDRTLDAKATSAALPVTLDQRAIGEYACEILSSLRALTFEARLDFLTYLIDMAYEEAVNTSNPTAAHAGEEDE